MKKIKIAVAFLLLTLPTFAQDFDVNKPFSKIVEEKEAYFANLRKQYGDDILKEEGGAYNEYRRWYNYWITRISPNSTMAEYNAKIGASVTKSSGTRSVGNLDNWYELGPYDKPTAGINDIGNGGSDRGIGIINSIIIHPNNPNKLLANSKAGGLFYSANKGQNWNNAGSDKWWRSGCSAMAFAPNNETTWYASSTMGGTFYAPPIGAGGGVYRTDNSGLVWNLIADKLDFDPNPSVGETVVINCMRIDPVKPNVCYVGTNKGLFKSSNVNDVTPSNVIWTKVSNDYIEDIEFKMDGSSIAFIAHKNSTNQWFISTTTNEGVSWSVLPNYTFDVSTAQVVIEVSQANTNLVWALDRGSNTKLRIFNTSTLTWLMQPMTFLNMVGAGHGFGVSNFNANIIYVSYYDRFRKSTDGGATFTNVELSAAATRYHADVEDIVTPFANCATCASSSNEVYVATHGGVNYSNDNVATLTTRSYGLGVAKITEPSNSETNPEEISMGLDHDGTVLSDGAFGQNWMPSWKTIYGGDGGRTQIDYSNPNILWYEPQMSNPKVSTNKAITTGSTNFPISNDFYVEMTQNRTFPKVLYSKARSGGSSTQYEDVYRSNNSGLVGSTTEQISNFQMQPSPLPMGQWVWGIFPARTNPAYLYANVSSNAPNWIGHLYRTKDALNPSATAVKASWEELPLPASSDIKSVDVRNENIVYFASGGQPWNPVSKLYKVDYTTPTNAIASMIDISGDPATGGLPDLPINGLVQELGSNGGIYVSTDIGVYYANNTTIIPNGDSVWKKIGTNLPNIPLGKVEINYVANKIRVATPGRGIWEHDLWCPNNLSGNYSGAQTGTQYLEVNNEIKSTATVSNTSAITYRAGTYIELNPGFVGTPTSTGFFEGFIHGCSYIGSSPFLNKTIDMAEETTLTAINQEKGSSDIIAYPNPTDGIIIINIANDDKYDLKVYNQNGSLVFEKNDINVRNFEIDMSRFTNGLYFIKCNNSIDFKMIKILKK